MLREGRRALELLTESKDACYEVDIGDMFTLICARLGEGQLAIPSDSSGRRVALVL